MMGIGSSNLSGGREEYGKMCVNGDNKLGPPAADIDDSWMRFILTYVVEPVWM